MRITDKRKWAALTQRLNDFKIEAGWFENNRYENGISVAEVARVQNYGANIKVTDKMRKWFAAQGFPLKKDTQNIIIPPRPFMDNAAQRVKGQEGYNKLIGMMMAVFDNKITLEQGVNQLGLWIQSVIQEEIIKINSPALSGFTIEQRKAKGEKGTKPLQATGQMLASIQSRVTMK